MSYLEQINQAIDYIERHLFDPLNIEEISQTLGISKWVFQRIFRGMVGDTVKEYISKRRLSYAAQALLDSKAKVIDVAFAHGFESHEVFLRAFKRDFGVTPSTFRAATQPKGLPAKKLKITAEYLTHLYQGITMEPTLIQSSEKQLIGRAGQIKPVLEFYEDNQTVVSQLWQNFREFRSSLPEYHGSEKVGLITEQGGTLEYCAGVELSLPGALPEGFVSRTIPAGEYAEFTHQHTACQNSINHTYHYIYGSWLPKSGREASGGPEVVVYPIDFHPGQDAQLKIRVPLK